MYTYTRSSNTSEHHALETHTRAKGTRSGSGRDTPTTRAVYVTVDCQPLFPDRPVFLRASLSLSLANGTPLRDSLAAHRPMHSGERTCLFSHDNNGGDN